MTALKLPATGARPAAGGGKAGSAGEALSAARIGEEMTQKQLAAVSGIDQADISKIERGLANPSLNTLDRLADALGKTLVIRFE